MTAHSLTAQSPADAIAPVAIYLAGEITQFVDSTPAQCGDAVYQPFTELEQTIPDK